MTLKVREPAVVKRFPQSASAPGFDQLRHFRDLRWPERRQHPAVHGGGEFEWPIRDYIHVGGQQRAHQRY